MRVNITFDSERDPGMYGLLQWLKKEAPFDERIALRTALLAFYGADYAAFQGKSHAEILQALGLSQKALMIALQDIEQRRFDLTEAVPNRQPQTEALSLNAVHPSTTGFDGFEND